MAIQWRAGKYYINETDDGGIQYRAGQYYINEQDAAAGGSLIKTWDGLAIASVKTINGLAIASVKNVNGLTNV